MSVQETNLEAIAEAIRQKEGSTGPIQASRFAERILALPTGGGGSCTFAVPLVVTVEPGALVTAVNGEHKITGTADDSGSVTLTLPAPGTWTVTAALEGKEQSKNIEVADGYTAQFHLSSRLPEGYTEVRYIESTGTQYINIGLTGFDMVSIETEIEHTFNSVSTTQYILGASYKYSTSYYFWGFYLGSNGGITARYRKQYKELAKISPARKVTYKMLGPTKTYEADGNSFTFSSDTASISNSTTLHLFGLHEYSGQTSYLASVRVYSFDIRLSDGSLYRQLVPCINPQGKAGLYDLVNNIFFANKGTGEFVTGPAV